MITSYNEGLSQYWHPVMRAEDLLIRQSQLVKLLDKDVLLCRLDGKIAALSNLCRHFQASLSDGNIEIGCERYSGEFVRCAYHGWAFNGAGECVDIPQLPKDKRIPPAARIEAYEVQEKFGLIWVCLSSSPRRSLPDFPECDSTSMAATPIQYTEPWPSSVFRMVQSALDDYHFPWLHEGVLGSRDRPQPPSRIITQTEYQIHSQFVAIQPANVTNSTASSDDSSAVDYEMIVDLPNIIRLIKKNSGGLYVVCFFPTPISYDRTGIFWRVFRTYDLGVEGDARIVEMEKFIQSQDRSHVGKQKMWAMNSFPLAGADDAIVAYLKGLENLGLPSRL